jgi:hypothetical protein
LTQVENATVSNGLSIMLGYGAGSLDPSFATAMSSKAMIECSTTQLRTVFNSGSVDLLGGVSISNSSSVTSADVYHTQYSNLASITSGSSHRRTRVNRGLLVPKSLSCSQGGEATLSFSIIPVYDGTNDPIAHNEAVALPSTLVTEKFTLGPVYINGTAVDSVQDINADFGQQIEMQSASGLLYDSFACVSRRTPSLSIGTHYVPSLSGYGLTGTAIASTTTINLTRMQKNGQRYGNNTNNHIVLTVYSGMVHADSFTGSDGLVKGSIVIKPTNENGATSNLLGIAVDQVIA